MDKKNAFLKIIRNISWSHKTHEWGIFKCDCISTRAWYHLTSHKGNLFIFSQSNRQHVLFLFSVHVIWKSWLHRKQLPALRTYLRQRRLIKSLIKLLEEETFYLFKVYSACHFEELEIYSCLVLQALKLIFGLFLFQQIDCRWGVIHPSWCLKFHLSEGGGLVKKKKKKASRWSMWVHTLTGSWEGGFPGPRSWTPPPCSSPGSLQDTQCCQAAWWIQDSAGCCSLGDNRTHVHSDTSLVVKGSLR